jgi:DNA-binding SARP family transcriptional activator/tetratricopeptide (TPR) repeat protein
VDLQTPRNPVPQLRVLGGATLRCPQGSEHGPESRRHPLALLVLLATAPERALSRAKLAGLLWPDVDEPTGRNRLTSALYHLRQRLGRNAIVSMGDALRLEPDALDCDVWRFQEALGRRDETAAVRLYRGPFLDGFHLPGAVEFDHHVDRERGRLWHDYCEALESLAERAESDGSPAVAVRWWRERAADDPYDTSIALRLVEALVTAGNPEEALRVAEAHQARLRRELGAASHAELEAVLERLPALSSPPTARSHSIAVLPFEALGDVRTAMGDGIHIGLLDRLSGIAGLGVIARTTVLQYRNSGQTVAQIGRELGVDWVLEGDVQVSGREFRLSVRLVHPGTDRQMWAQQYRGDLSTEDLLDLQADLTKEIYSSLKVEVTREERDQAKTKPTQSVEAYRLWAEGRMYLDRRSAEEMSRAVDRFERAIELDPEYVQAWAGLADALGLLHAYGFFSANVLERAEAAIARALDLDPRSAEAHAARGRLLGQRMEALEAQRELELAVALKPGYAEAHNWLSVGSHALGHREAALKSARRALELDPLSPEVVYNFASSLFINGEHKRALVELRRLRDMAPAYGNTRFLQGIVVYEMGEYDQAASMLEGLEVPWTGAGTRTALALALIALGDPDAARRLLAGIDRSRYAFDTGLVLVALDEKAVAWEAFDEVDFRGLDFWSSFWPTIALRYMFTDVWEKVRHDARYAGLVKRMDQSWGL